MVLDDVERACEVCSGLDSWTFSKIYFSSNESLKHLFRYFSVKDKDVLTVLGSSDQLFYANYHGARNVDCFDVNGLTKYYYYLRRWALLYQKEYYPSTKMFQNHSYLIRLLDKVKCKNEEEEKAYLFWRTFIERVTPRQHENLYSVDFHNNEIRDMRKLRNIVEEEEFHFYHDDLFDEVTNSKKYDIIITSNVLEYAWNSLKLQKCHDNLKSLLKDGGQVIGSHFVFYPDFSCFLTEKELFETDFDYFEFPSYSEGMVNKKYPLGYSYTKKKC